MILPGILLGLSVLASVYLILIRPRQLRWGATDQEIKLVLPGDELVPRPDFNATRAISIHNTPREIWKWIIQIGSKRAGWYSIDLIDNAGIASAESIIPEFQVIETGQFIPFTPNQKNGMWVKEFREHEYILWVDKAGKASWVWYIYETEKGESRLLTRLHIKYIWKGFWIIYYLVSDFGDIVMMRKCLKGIKRRAERLKTDTYPPAGHVEK